MLISMMANTFKFIGCIINGVICGVAISFAPFLLRRFDGVLDIVLDVILNFAIIAGSFTLMWYVFPVRTEKVIFLLWVLGIALGRNYILLKE
mgnify:CR=1 FL=1